MSDYRRTQAFQAGRKAGLAGLDVRVCKRMPGTIYFDDWHDGHAEGLRERQTREVQP